MLSEIGIDCAVSTDLLLILACGTLLITASVSAREISDFSLVSTIQDHAALGRAHDVEILGDFMFVPGKGGSVAIIDVGDPEEPRLVWSADLGEDAQTVLPWNQHLFVGSRDFVSIDISDPGRASVRNRLRNRPQIDRINGMIAWGDHILYANKQGWIGAVDVSQPDEPVFAGAVNTEKRGNIISPHDIAIFGDYAVIVDQRDGSPLKVRAYRVADSETGDLLPVERWEPAGSVSGDRLNGANRVVVSGDYAMVGCNKSNTLAVIDFSDPTAPKTVRILPFPGEPCGLTLAGSVLLAAGGRAIRAVDVNNPRRPEALATFESEEIFASKFARTDEGEKRYTTIDGKRQVSSGNAHDLVYRRGLVYVTAQNDDQVGILRVENPKIRRLAESPPAKFGGECVPVKVKNGVTMTADRRVRPQALLFGDDERLARLLYSTNGSGGVSIASGLAETSDGGTTWADHAANPVLNRIESDWQGRRAFVTAVTRDEEAGRWVMATVGDDTSGATPGKRAVGLWFSEDLVRWTQHAGNPIITVETDDALTNDEILPGPDDPPVGMYLRDFRKMDGTWHALVQWRGNQTWSRMTVMRSTGDITGPWEFRNLCIDPVDATEWFTKNRNLNWCQPVHAGGRWYAACQNGVASGDRDNHHVGIVYSDDYFHWHEFDNPVTAPLTRPDGSRIVSSQQFLLPPEGDEPWRILLGARGVHGGRYMYLVYP